MNCLSVASSGFLGCARNDGHRTAGQGPAAARFTLAAACVKRAATRVLRAVPRAVIPSEAEESRQRTAYRSLVCTPVRFASVSRFLVEYATRIGMRAALRFLTAQTPFGGTSQQPQMYKPNHRLEACARKKARLRLFDLPGSGGCVGQVFQPVVLYFRGRSEMTGWKACPTQTIQTTGWTGPRKTVRARFVETPKLAGCCIGLRPTPPG